MIKLRRSLLIQREPKETLNRPSRGISRCRFVVSLLLTLLFTFTSAWAQKDTGAIAGTVTDASGRVVVGAKVRVTDVDRGTEVDTVTSEAGEYTVSPLKIGRYKVAVEKTGFKTELAGPVVVEVQEHPTVDVT
ncbi:MAG: carboxypeptidase-like regulatory domain-containing protein, partial [Candidatus Acidiferrales bacterium]